MSDPHVLLVITGACGLPGGIAGVNQNVLRAVADLAEQRGHAMTVLSLLERASARPPFLPGWVRFRAFGGRKPVLAARLIREAARSRFVFFDHVRLAWPILPLAACGAVRTVIFAHGWEAWKQVRRTSRWSFQAASLCLANSGFTLRKMRHTLTRFKGRTCLLGLSPLFALNVAIPEPSAATIRLEAADGVSRPLGERVLLLVARLDPRERLKGHRELIRVLPALRSHDPDVQLVFPGPGADRKNLIALARGLGVASSVFLPGWLPVVELRRLYESCYAFVMPSRQEGFGLVYLEAMNAGKPCVGCWDDGAEDVIVPGETGLLVRHPSEPAQLISALRTLLDDPYAARTMGAKGFKRLHALFTSEHVQSRIKSHLAEMFP